VVALVVINVQDTEFAAIWQKMGGRSRGGVGFG